MNITFLLGNGFDLNLGLATKYSDFLQEYLSATNNDPQCIQFFKHEILQDQTLWSDAEIAFGSITAQFKSAGYTAEDYCTCHEDFCIKLSEYLSNQISAFNDSVPTPILADNFAHSLLHYKDSFRETERALITGAENRVGGGFNLNFINFNYTSTVDTCVSAAKRIKDVLGKRNYGGTQFNNHIGQVLHIHGTISKDMVLGVNDTSQIADLSLFDDFDDEYLYQIIKQQTNNANGENLDKKGLDLLSSSDLIYIYGMSIGSTDALWWQRICQLLLNNERLHLIIHHFDAPPETLIMRRYRLFVKNAKKEFTSFSKCDETQKDSIEKRIHIDTTNLFNKLSNIACTCSEATPIAPADKIS